MEKRSAREMEERERKGEKERRGAAPRPAVFGQEQNGPQLVRHAWTPEKKLQQDATARPPRLHMLHTAWRSSMGHDASVAQRNEQNGGRADRQKETHAFFPGRRPLGFSKSPSRHARKLSANPQYLSQWHSFERASPAGARLLKVGAYFSALVGSSAFELQQFQLFSGIFTSEPPSVAVRQYLSIKRCLAHEAMWRVIQRWRYRERERWERERGERERGRSREEKKKDRRTQTTGHGTL